MRDELDIYGELAGQTALVTGSSRNLGQEIAVTLAEAGVNIGITSRTDQEACEETAELVAETGSESAIQLGDIANERDIDNIVTSIREELGPIDILVHNAAARKNNPFDMTADQWDYVQNVNLRSAFLFAQRVAPDMIEKGKGNIVLIGGQRGFEGKPDDKIHATASKAGLHGLTRALAGKLGLENIRTNCVVPGRKPTGKERGEATDLEQKHFDIIAKSTPLGRRSTTEEIAKVVRFFVSDEASFVNGEIVKVDGGLSIQQTGAHLFR